MREKLIGMFRGDHHMWSKIPEDDEAYDSDHTVFDHSDLGAASLCSGRWRFDSNLPSKVVWSDEPSESQKASLVSLLGKRGYVITRHHVWAFSDNPAKNRIIDSTSSCYRRDGD